MYICLLLYFYAQYLLHIFRFGAILQLFVDNERCAHYNMTLEKYRYSFLELFEYKITLRLSKVERMSPFS